MNGDPFDEVLEAAITDLPEPSGGGLPAWPSSCRTSAMPASSQASMRETFVLASPAGDGAAITTTIPIEGRAEWIAALEAAGAVLP